MPPIRFGSVGEMGRPGAAECILDLGCRPGGVVAGRRADGINLKARRQRDGRGLAVALDAGPGGDGLSWGNLLPGLGDGLRRNGNPFDRLVLLGQGQQRASAGRSFCHLFNVCRVRCAGGNLPGPDFFKLIQRDKGETSLARFFLLVLSGSSGGAGAGRPVIDVNLDILETEN